MFSSLQYRGVIIDLCVKVQPLLAAVKAILPEDPTAATRSCAWRSYCRAAN